MNDMDFALDPVRQDTPVADENMVSRLFLKYERWWKRRTLHQLPPGSVKHLVTERLHERELFLNEVKEQLHDLEHSIDELTDTIRSMRGNER